MNKKIVIFGGSGFIGSHVADRFTENGDIVTIFDIKKSPYLKDKQKMVIGDVLDEDFVDSVIHVHDYVVNFAGLADIDYCLNNPVDAVRYNILGNTIILNASAKYNVKRYIFASSMYVYSKLGAIYKNTKQACELLIDTYAQTRGLKYSIVRYGSLYGPRADKNNRIYKIIKSAIEDKKIEYDGTGNEIREFIHVRDASTMTVTILYYDEYENQNIILTGKDAIEYKRLLNMVNEMLDNKIEITYFNKESDTHYITTPYYFSPKTGIKLSLNEHIDLGQGLLSMMEQIKDEVI